MNNGAWIIRIRMPFRHVAHPRNWLTKLTRYPVILDGLNSVTWADEMAMRSWQLMSKAPAGVYHCVQPEAVTTGGIAALLLEKGLREPFTTWDEKEFLKRHVKRSEAVLSCEKFQKAYGCKSTPAMSAISWCIDQLSLKA